MNEAEICLLINQLFLVFAADAQAAQRICQFLTNR